MEADNANPIHEILEFSPPYREDGTNAGISFQTLGKKVALGIRPASLSTITQVPQSFVEFVRSNLSSPVEIGKDILLLVGPSSLQGNTEARLGGAVLAFRAIRKRLDMMRLNFTAEAEVSRDPEEASSGTLLVAVKVKEIPYEKLLDLWDEMSEEFAANLDENLRGRVHLVLRSGE